MGRVIAEATIENLEDPWTANCGLLPPEPVRRVTGAAVDSGATLLALPTRLMRQLGLAKTGSKKVVSGTGFSEAATYEAARRTIQGDTFTMDVMDVPDDVPVSIGELPFEHLNLVVGRRSRSLIGNPAHAGKHAFELN